MARTRTPMGYVDRYSNICIIKSSERPLVASMVNVGFNKVYLDAVGPATQWKILTTTLSI
jgi:hypothetical protein